MIPVQPLMLFIVISVVIVRSSSQDEPLRPTLTLVWGNQQQLLVRETATMLCTIPGNKHSNWKYWWFKDGQPIRQFGLYDDFYTLTAKLPQDGGLYTCQGRTNTTETELQDTLQSHPLKIDVSGGWVVLQVPPAPLLTGDNVTLTCRVRGKKRVTEAVFFKDGLELQRQLKPNLHLSCLTKEDQGVYWCRATWWQDFQWHTSQSLPVEVPINEVLTMPHLAELPATSIPTAAILMVPGPAEQQGPKPTATLPLLRKPSEAVHGHRRGAPHRHGGWGTAYRAVPLQSDSEQTGFDQAVQGSDGGGGEDASERDLQPLSTERHPDGSSRSDLLKGWILSRSL
ncbi:high affinity immunoglobulin gamma Fc receptor I-like [Brienomyrus brachyistius]|uniref:high affinity immunoglobulin gamma Fc receptor I-like n=1 Tax=Brienomyrus brachyistius TaxID=42636 RepID=UPI0020B18269|nr:high affinity immunoglobulin gamma Fc receptor I-like [Brienomyrus brachyistius]